MCNWRWLLLWCDLAFLRTFTSTSDRHFLLNFPCQPSSLSMKFSFVSDSWAKSCIFPTVLPTLLCCLFWRGKRGVPNPMIALEVFVQGKFMALISESYWSTSNSGCLHGPPCFFLFAVLLGFAKASHKRWIQFVARQVEASLVIRAAKLKFVQESRTRVSFVQSLGSTSWREMLLVLTENIFLQLVSQHCCIASWNSLLRVLPRLRQVGHKRGSTRNNKFQLAMQQCWDKLKKNVVCITGP